MKGWKEGELGELISIKHGWAFKGEFFSTEGERIIVTPGNFIEEGGFRVREGKEKFYLGKFPGEYLLKKGDLVIAMTEQGPGLLGSPGLIPESNRFLHNQRIGLIEITQQDLLDRNYLYYLFFTSGVRNKIFGSATGTKVKHTAPKRIYSIEVSIPSLSIQRRIASILSAYDDLIENNLRRIKLLEELAQRTYEEWFVRFRFPGFEASNINSDWLPEGWERKKLGEVIDYEIGGGWGNDEPTDEFSASGFVIRGTDMNNLILGNIENVPYRYHKPSNMASRKIQHGDILFEVSGGSSNEGVGKTILMVDKIIDQFFDDIMCASFCKLVRPISVEYSNYLFLFFQFLRKAKTTEIWEIRSASNIVNYNWTSFLKYQDVIVPEVNTLRKFNSFVDDLVDQIYSLGNQNRLLKESRDILLPRLMSGEIELDELRNMEDGMLMAAEPKGEYKTLKNHG